MIKIEEIKEMAMDQVRETLQNDSAEYTTKVEQMNLEECQQEESVIIKELEDYDNYLNNTAYELPNIITFEGETISRVIVSDIITKLIDKWEVEWDYALGMYQLSQYWKTVGVKESTIGYKVCDSTLRILGGVKYKGAKEWKNIMIVNEFMSSVYDSYNRDTTYLMYLSKLHSAVLDQMQKLNAPAEIVNEMAGDNI